jgi:hypothetical protein
MVGAEQGGEDREPAVFFLSFEGDRAFLEGSRGTHLRGTEEKERRRVAVSAAGGGGVGTTVAEDVGGDGSGEVVRDRIGGRR